MLFRESRTFRRLITFPSSGSKSTPTKKQKKAGDKQISASIAGLLIDPEDGGDGFPETSIFLINRCP
jgi:hypothetical protein